MPNVMCKTGSASWSIYFIDSSFASKAPSTILQTAPPRPHFCTSTAKAVSGQVGDAEPTLRFRSPENKAEEGKIMTRKMHLAHVSPPSCALHHSLAKMALNFVLKRRGRVWREIFP